MTLPQPYPPFRAWDDYGDPLVGGKVYTYEGGTSTEKTTYSNYNLTTPNANPVVLDSNGEAYIFLGPGLTKFVLKTSAGVTLWTLDNLGPGAETATNEYHVDTYGAVADGTTDCTEAFNDAITAAHDAGGGTVVGSAGTYRIDTGQVEIPDTVNFKFAGVDRTIFDCRGSATPFKGTANWYHQRFEGFTVTHANNTSGTNIAMWDADKGSQSCYFDFKLIGKNGVTQDGLIIRAGSGGVANPTPANNIINIRTTKSSVSACTGKALYLYGDDSLPNRCNANTVYGVYDGFATGVWVCGAENLLYPACNSATWGIHLYGDATVRNIIQAKLDQGGSACPIKLESTAAGRIHMATIIESVNAVANITATGTSYDPSYVWIYKTIYVGTSKGIVDFDSIDSPVIPGYAADNVMMLWGDRTADSNCGRIIVAGASFAGGVAAVSNSGGVSAAIRNHASAEFRVVKKTDDVATFTNLFAVTSAGAIQDLVTSNGPVGTLTLSNGGGTTTTENNTSVTANSLIYLFPTSANAAAAVGSATGVYISAKSAGTSFTVTHPASPGASATMNYLILN